MEKWQILASGQLHWATWVHKKVEIFMLDALYALNNGERNKAKLVTENHHKLCHYAVHIKKSRIN